MIFRHASIAVYISIFHYYSSDIKFNIIIHAKHFAIFEYSLKDSKANLMFNDIEVKYLINIGKVDNENIVTSNKILYSRKVLNTLLVIKMMMK